MGAVLFLGVGISLSAAAAGLPYDQSLGSVLKVEESHFNVPINIGFNLGRDVRLIKTVQESIEGEPDAPAVGSTISEMATTTTSQTTTTTSTETTTSTISAATTTSTEETRIETTEAELTDPEPVAWEEDTETEETDSESTGDSVYDYVGDWEIVMLAKTVAQEGGDCSYTQQACVIWTVLNRVDSPEWPNTISENLTMSGQFAYYSDKDYREDHYRVAYDQVYNWLFGGDRYLSSEYQYFYGDGRRNHFYGKNTGEYVPD
jgi:hypothetical protein